jgi:hypothetical protein
MFSLFFIKWQHDWKLHQLRTFFIHRKLSFSHTMPLYSWTCINLNLWKCAQELLWAQRELSRHQCFTFYSSPFSTRAHNFAEYINSTTVFLYSKISMLRLYEKKNTQSVFLKVCWTQKRLSPYQLMVCSQKKKTRHKAKSSLFYTIFFKLWAEFLKCCRFNIFKPTSTVGLADDLLE